MGCSISIELVDEDDEPIFGRKGESEIGVKEERREDEENDDRDAIPDASPPLSASYVGTFLDPSKPARKFKMKEILDATEEFNDSNLIGEGSSGRVFRGMLNDKVVGVYPIAVKRLKPESMMAFDEWLDMVLLMEKLRHRNVLRMYGYCAEKGEAVLAYELCKRGSLQLALFGGDSIKTLSWRHRVRIATDVVKGLAYLHDNKLVHSNLKPSNVLLADTGTAYLMDFSTRKREKDDSDDDDDDAKVADKNAFEVLKKAGYMDPTCENIDAMTSKTDIYALGVLLLVLLTGRPALDASLSPPSVLTFIEPQFKQSKPNIEVLVDPKLEGKFPKEGAFKFAVVAKNCISAVDQRPTIDLVLSSIELVETK